MKTNIAILALLGNAHAWWGNGHLLVARIALELSDATLVNKVN
jgi:hypothetical protein